MKGGIYLVVRLNRPCLTIDLFKSYTKLQNKGWLGGSIV